MSESVMHIQDICSYLPQRYPFLLIDRVTDITCGESIRAVKNVSYNEPFFGGHFPKEPIMPGVLIIEAMAQATGILAFKTSEKQPSEGAVYLLVGVDNARFKRQVVPGDQLVLTVRFLTRKRDLWKFEARASVDGKAVAHATILCTEQKKSAND